ncbi:MAG: hypothetical protein AMQ74_01466 [Candidatus Methanofastidiosum methylothiophilum]|uniref:MazG nucleotide pyrophosphohydrolase domain protein n=1 Tax=Candidatus Methanofastidiosum methylothiophilum TaxID=1705564 RepID=A0A150IWD8_9EURY|nr:MAG: hypothetical protein AMQ74_01466 [Candidatus Methanofastidiosum methylthiophilus]
MLSVKLIDLINEAYKTADEHGWHSINRTFGDLIALCHGELSEALEEYRDGGLNKDNLIYYKNDKEGNIKPEGVAVEIADLLIRVFDLCKDMDIPIIDALKIKMEYNKLRPYLHGGKKI